MEQNSKLGYLLERFSVTGKELADILHIDYSLVSKWRNHTRILTPRSEYLQSICDYFISLDSINHCYNLKEIILNVYPNAQLTTTKEISIYLKRWLLSNDQVNNNVLSNIINSENLMEGNFYIFKGDSGRRDAVNKFMDIALTDPKAHELMLYSQENASWINEDFDFIKIWRKKNFDFLNSGGKIYLIHTIDRLYKTIAFSLIHWLPLHMTDKTSPYYYPITSSSTIKSTIFVIKDCAVVFGTSTEDSSKNISTFLCLEPTLVKQFQNTLQSLLSESHPLFERFYSRNTNKLRDSILEANKGDENNYFISLPPFFLMSQETLRRILFENDIPEKNMNEYLAYNAEMQKQLANNSSNHFYRFIIDMDRLKKVVSADTIILNNIFPYCGAPIKTSKSRFLETMHEMLNVMDITPNLNIALTDGPPSFGLDGIDMWVKQNTIVYSSTILDENTSFSLVTSEITTVNSCFYNLNQIWNTIPKVKYDKEWVRQRLLHLVSNLYSN